MTSDAPKSCIAPLSPSRAPTCGCLLQEAYLLQALVLKYPEPVSVEDLRLRAVVSSGLAALAQGQQATSQTLLLQAIKGMEAQYRPPDSPIHAPVWAALANSARATGQTANAQAYAAKAKRAATQAP